jgi:outer membrane usher protein
MLCRRFHKLFVLCLALHGSLVQAQPELQLFELRINKQVAGQNFVLQDGDTFLLPTAILEQWRLRDADTAPVEYAGRTYVSLDGWAGTTAVLDKRQLVLDIEFPATAFAPSQLDLGREKRNEAQGGRGAFLDYDLTLFDEGEQAGEVFSGLLQPTLFAEERFFTSSHVYTSGSAFAEPGWLRLETRIGGDDEDHLRSWQAGDAISAGSNWGRAIRFGGLQFGTNFATRPEFVPFPLPSMSGEAAVPSVVDVYVNNSLAASSNVPAGPFSVQDVPVVTGDGQIRLVVRDALGREQVIAQDFYTSTALLRPGLADYSLNVGWTRERFGIESNNYGSLMSVGQARYGLTDRLTGEIRGEFGDGGTTVGVGLATALGERGIATTALATGGNDEGRGLLWLMGYEYQGTRARLNTRVTGRDRRFTQLGVGHETEAPRLEWLASGGLSLGNQGSLGLALVTQQFDTKEDSRLLTVTFSRTLGQSTALSLLASQVSAKDSELRVGLFLSTAFGRRHSASAGFERDGERDELRLQARRDLPLGTGFGYRLGAAVHDATEFDFDIAAQSGAGRHALETRLRDSGGLAWRASTAGGLVALSGSGIHPAREIGEAFAIADVGDYAEVRVYLENLEVGRTDENGRVLLPRLRPYQRNRVSIEQADLPLEARIDSLELMVTPRARSGQAVQFPVRTGQNVLLEAFDTAGAPLPVGARAVTADGQRFLVGRDGLLYLSGVKPGEAVDMEWAGNRCRIRLPLQLGIGPMPKQGRLQCH